MHLGAGLVAVTDGEPERHGEVRLGSARFGPRDARDVEQFILLAGVQVQRRARHPIRPARRCVPSWAAMVPTNSGGPPDCTGGGPTGRTDWVIFPPAHTLFTIATRSAMPRIVCDDLFAPTAR